MARKEYLNCLTHKGRFLRLLEDGLIAMIFELPFDRGET